MRTKRDAIRDTWHHMKNRCIKLDDSAYRWYGGRGIKVCDRWLDQTKVKSKTKPTTQGFLNFLEDMGSTWFEGATIDRIDNDGDYTPENCRWLSKNENLNEMHQRRILNGTHPFQGDRNPSIRKVKNKTHNFFGGSIQSENTKGRIWVTDGVINKRILPSQFVPDGFYKGVTRK